MQKNRTVSTVFVLYEPVKIFSHAPRVTAKSSQDVRVTAGDRNVTISWRTPGTAPPLASYVVEWYPEGQKMEELGWVRLGRRDDHAVITGGATINTKSVMNSSLLQKCW